MLQIKSLKNKTAHQYLKDTSKREFLDKVKYNYLIKDGEDIVGFLQLNPFD